MVNSTDSNGKTNKKLWSERFKRLLRYRLVIPLKRSRHPPEYTARGVAVGTFWALTPTVGIQMAVVLIHWWVSRRFFRQDFSVVNAMAWTWITNVFTLLPFYYLFYVTGQFMLGAEKRTGYSGFVQLWKSTVHSAVASDVPLAELVQTWGALVFKDWFAAMSVGSLPYAILGAWLAWRWSLALVKAYREARRRRAERRERAARERAALGWTGRGRAPSAPPKRRRTGTEGANCG